MTRFPFQAVVLTTCCVMSTQPTCAGRADVDAAAAPMQHADVITLDELIQAGVERILQLQEGDAHAEWPYEGVYRVPEEGQRGAVIPIGYRVGGTAICATALMHSPGYADDIKRVEAVERAARFIIDQTQHPLMAFEEIISNYDVRGWGYTYGVQFLLQYQHEDWEEEILAAIEFCLKGIAATEIPENGGWNYARRGGFDQPGPMSPFMTAPTVQTLLLAKTKGFEVDDAMIERGLDALELARTESGGYVYSGTAGPRANDLVPGSIGRMVCAEATLFMAGRSSASDVRGAVDAFFVHWDWLDKRRAQTGTHVAPYGVAPYYFYFAHYYAAQAIELLPEPERAEYRRRLREVLLRNRLEDGSWNDRVFARSASYGTAMSIMALMMKDIE
ncbi:MAG: hypothetical protein ACR2GY_07730 [Phycisphaerales bacterium]